jgi:anti-sigma regulatory factor (Ser/Thr protein kinase)
MTTTTPRRADGSDERFRHEALLYSGQSGFVEQTGRFIRDSLEANEPILVVVSGERIALLRSVLGADAAAVRFADMSEVGLNPARIIAAWRGFVAEHAGAGWRFRGVGEPVWSGRSPEELAECARHEALLNLAFEDSPGWWLVCPYDTEALDPSVIEDAHRNHPSILENGVPRPSGTFPGVAELAKPFDRPLSEPPGPVMQIGFGLPDLHLVRHLVARHARTLGFDRGGVIDVVLAVNELATNTVRHADGRGVLRTWETGDGSVLVCEVRDGGRFDNPLAGREPPSADSGGGFGLWLVNNLCDLAQVRTFATGSVVRIHVRRR